MNKLKDGHNNVTLKGKKRMNWLSFKARGTKLKLKKRGGGGGTSLVR